MSEGIDVGTFAHHGESYALGHSLEAERSAPKRITTAAVAPLDTAHQINRDHRRVFEQATRERLGNVRCLADINRHHHAQWRQPS